ncbi:MAG: hypothetical protein JWQ38_3315, partial [Flavipsychrobacter sp.]|nr:hypothetical protein [Flavipsychrobacter sp.]
GTKQYILYGVWLVVLSVVFAALQSAFLHIGFFIPMLFLLLFSMSIILESFLIVFKNFISLSAINFCYAAGYVIIHKVVLDEGFTYNSIFLYLFVLTAIKVVAYAILTVKSIAAHKGDEHVELRPAAEVRKLWINLGLYDILQTLESWVDKFIISLVLTSTLSAIYYNGSQNIPFLPVVLGAAGSAVLMQMHKVNAADERTSLLHLMNYSSRLLSNIVFPLFFYLVFFRYELFAALLPDYKAAVPVFFIFLFLIPLRAYNFTIVFQKMHKGHYSNIGAIIDLVLAIVFMYPLYLWLGLPGVALSFIISCYLQGAYYFYHISRLLQTSWVNLVPFSNWALKLVVFGVLFKIVHSVVISFFNERIALTIGAMSMFIIMGVSLMIELKNHRKHGNA